MWADLCPLVGAGNGIRTRDIQLGRLPLYELAYSRDSFRCAPEVGGGRRIRTFEGVSRQIYSLLPLAARASLLDGVCLELRVCLRLEPFFRSHSGGDSRLPPRPPTRFSKPAPKTQTPPRPPLPSPSPPPPPPPPPPLSPPPLH